MESFTNIKYQSGDLWKNIDYDKYQMHVTTISINSTTNPAEEIDDKVVYMEDLEKRRDVYGICRECNEPGTGEFWCQSCNAKRSKENFKNWTSGNKDIDEFIQHSQLNAVHSSKYLEWIPYDDFQDIYYVSRGGFGKIYSAEWLNGYIRFWDIEYQRWDKNNESKVALKSLDNSSDISTDFLNEIRSHLQIHLYNVIRCYGITQDPNTNDYMMVLEYCDYGNLRKYYFDSRNTCIEKIIQLSEISRGLFDIHNVGIVHKDLHSGNILHKDSPPGNILHKDLYSNNILDGNVITYISDLGMCQSANNKERSVKKEGVYGVLPYMAPEILREHQYTKSSDIYSFGIVMNEYLSEQSPYNGIPHDHILATEICKGFRPKIPDDEVPKLLADLIMKCWDAKPENRPTAKELYQVLNKLKSEYDNENNEIYTQIQKCEKIRSYKYENNLNSSTIVHINSRGIYHTSRLLSFENLPEPVNSTEKRSELFDCQI